ncbi:hypothetical protein COX93_00010 [Candidatus Nomurabacteria bacterium CG_4_10_14_0_2_um_filter_30_12]|uniref:Membrane protein 6-pyruvoyl-tetrahydropterin synthase-related domain-containing protein n=1 Tax=Candidatus Nomurabacteria bacterium CG_4_10_14_0_2_um_filter_30_12 TaxID=1974727 RepID=A0A2J0MIA2_9BACT|nr:MAG: hypothetical protein COX93_00010 [Candidatus Nomurabacteria bacterium CG_4_10_14_0_2_um_filter_30_12]
MYKTHDGDYHTIRAFHFYSELKHHQFPVRMSVDVPYSYGYSTFEFFYPFPYYVATIFQFLGVSTTLSWKLLQLIVTLASLSVFYLWMRKHLDKSPAITAIIVYGLVPFRFLTLYVTGQVGGYLGLLFVSLIGLSLNQLITSKRNNGVLLSIVIACLITAHLLSIIIFFIPLSVYTSWLLYKNFSKQKLLSVFLWSFFGVCLSTFHLVPFMLEKSWVQLGNQILIDYTDHWVTIQQLIYSPWGYGTSDSSTVDAMSFQIGLSILFSWAISIPLIIFKNPKNKLIILFSLVFGLLTFLMTSYSKIVWAIIEPLQLIQFPWRLLAATSLVGSFLVGLVSQQLTDKKRLAFTIVVVFLAIYNVRNYTKPWPNNWKNDIDYLNNQQDFYGPTDISWELMPVTATKRPLKTPSFILNASNSAILTNKINVPETGKIKKILELNLEEPTEINLALWDLPVWNISVDDQLVKKKIAEDGTIIVSVEKGTHVIKVILEKTMIQKVSDIITLLSLIILIIYIAFPHSHKSTVK